MSNGIRGWIEGDESGREMLSRVQKERPYLHLPPPFHKVPIRVGNVIEVIGSSPSAKTHILMQSATHCILPQYCGGLGRLVFFVDLDCRFDILRLSQILKNRIIQTNGSDDEEIFGACMRRFRYIRCYDSLEFLATLKTLRHQIQRDREAQGITISCMMIDSIGAFHWVDRASTSFLGDNSRNLKRPCSPGSAVSSVSNKLVHREYMSSVWQSFVTLRILVQATDDHISIDRNHNKSVYLSEWLLPSQSYVDKFIVEDAGVFCVS
ncbi:DNA repair protein XRCC2 homolog isoform X2 [Ricinus communis]|uniref:DNA repair protein XRCC2 homolog isoform X2 n=1 Tax=Ricinus communis TaxID=3988 RepID=UPI00201ACE35|nr:DNA repair protein XRCC2 homolog isoform X2 [Ricinus communis]